MDSTALAARAEELLKGGDCRQAAQDYARAAAAADTQVARRATEVAMGCEHVPAAWMAVSRWRQLEPSDRDANVMYAAVALKLYRIEDARTALRAYWLASGGGAQSSPTPSSAARATRNMAQLTALLLAESDAPAVLAAMDGSVVPPVSNAPGAQVVLGEVALAAYDGERAERYARAALQQDENEPAALRVLARAQVLRGQGSEAEATARQAQAAHAVPGTFLRAEVLAALDRGAQAREQLLRLRSQGGPAAEIDRRLAALALDSGDFPEARRRLNDVLTRDGPDDETLLLLAEATARGGDRDGALAQYRRLYDSSVALSARTHAAALLLKRGAHEEAQALLADFAADHPEDELDVTLARARLLADNGEAMQGLALLDAALQRHPRHPAIEYDRAVILERAGRVNESIAALEQLLAQRPDDPTLLNALGYTLANHHLQLGHAEDLIRRALNVMPDSPAALDSLGWVHVRAGDPAGALDSLRRAYSLDHNAEIAAHWGEALWISGQQNAARRVWNTALARAPDSRELKATVDRFLPNAQP
ncbi:MAG: tetratricopeptide repeat protein [Proteobacteria bacterium]|nr:tetratricopeptide repeat protein [Pseudomonadota bacterium]